MAETPVRRCQSNVVLMGFVKGQVVRELDGVNEECAVGEDNRMIKQDVE